MKKIWKFVESAYYLDSGFINIVFIFYPSTFFFDVFQSKLQASVHLIPKHINLQVIQWGLIFVHSFFGGKGYIHYMHKS